MSYDDAYNGGYSGPSPSAERRLNNRISRNADRDPRDPDYNCEESEPGDPEPVFAIIAGIPMRLSL